MLTRLAIALCALGIAFAPAYAQQRPKIEKAADLPRFTYRVDGPVEDIVREAAKFKPFAAEVRHDTESVLAKYQIDDRATLRQLEGELALLDYLDGRYGEALKRAAHIQELHEKPAERLLSGMQLRAMVDARLKEGNDTSAAYRKEVGLSLIHI